MSKKEIVITEKINISDERLEEISKTMEEIMKKNKNGESIDMSGVLNDILNHIENLDREEIFVFGYLFGAIIGYAEGISEGIEKAVISSMSAFSDVIKDIADVLTKKDVENIIKKKFGGVEHFDTSENN